MHRFADFNDRCAILILAGATRRKRLGTVGWEGQTSKREWKLGSVEYQGLILLKQTIEHEGQYHHRSHLFSTHWWGEELTDDQATGRGKVQHVASGETRDFRDWSALVGVLLGMLQGLDR